MRLRKQKKVVAVTLATAIAVSTISASASAVSYDLAKGDVTIDQDADRGAFSYQGEDKKENRTYVNEDKEDDGKIIIKGDKDTPTENTVTVQEDVKKTDNADGSEGRDVDIVIDGVNADTSKTGESTVTVGEGANIDLTVKDSTLTTGGNGIDIGKDLDGKVVDYSSPVKAGQMLAEIDKLPVQLDVQRAEASKAQAIAGIARAKADIQQAKAKHQQARLDRERAEKLGPGDALSKSSYDQYIADEETARANVAVAEASLQEAEASLKQAEAALKKEMRNLEYTTIQSPVDGVVVKRLVNIGQTVVSSMSASSLFYIATDLSKLKIWAAVNEADIGSIRKGQEVLFTVDAFSGRKFKGTVDKIRLDATMTSNVVTYIVDIDVPNPDKLLIPYLTANVQFVVEDIRDAFLVSNAALRFRPETELVSAEQKAAFERMQPELAAPAQNGQKKKAVVWELRDNLLYPHLVTRGESNGMLTAITGETLREGMEIVSTAQILNRSGNSEDGASASASGETVKVLGFLGWTQT